MLASALLPHDRNRTNAWIAGVVDITLRRQFRYEFKVTIRTNSDLGSIFGFAVGTKCHCFPGARDTELFSESWRNQSPSYYPGHLSAIV